MIGQYQTIITSLPPLPYPYFVVITITVIIIAVIIIAFTVRVFRIAQAK